MTSPARQQEQEPSSIHLPEHTLVPMFTALGLVVALIGLITNWAVVAVGGLILLLSVVRWITDVKHNISKLPE